MRRFSFVTSWQLFLSTSLCDYCLKEKQTKKKISPKLMGNGLKFTLTWIKSVDVDAQQQTPVQFAGKWETRHEQGHLLRKARIEMKWIDLGTVFERTMLEDSMEANQTLHWCAGTNLQGQAPNTTCFNLWNTTVHRAKPEPFLRVSHFVVPPDSTRKWLM